MDYYNFGAEDQHFDNSLIKRDILVDTIPIYDDDIIIIHASYHSTFILINL